MKVIHLFPLVLLCAFGSMPLAHAQEDAAGCQDPPPFGRMTGYFIEDCETQNFSAFEFPLADDDETVHRVEGKFWKVYYTIREDAQPNSPLAILRNFKNAVEKAAGKVVYVNETDWLRLTGTIGGDGGETWVCVSAHQHGSGYVLTVVAQKAMKQEVTAADMLRTLNSEGHIALHINFDTGKSSIKDESRPVIEQMYELLTANPGLTVEIQGHTDNVGKPEANLKLSDDRAKAVMTALLDKGIDAARLTAVGFGDSKPVAENSTEEGRAKNRRVELVKK